MRTCLLQAAKLPTARAGQGGKGSCAVAPLEAAQEGDGVDPREPLTGLGLLLTGSSWDARPTAPKRGFDLVTGDKLLGG